MHAVSRIILAFGACIRSTMAVALADFEPAAMDLSPACEAVYTTQIPGCTSSDFTTAAACSSACIDGVTDMTYKVYNACGLAASDNHLLIGDFLRGDGIHQLCGNVVVTTLGPTTIAMSTPAASSIMYTSGTMVLSSMAVPASILFDTSIPPVMSTVQSTSTYTSTTTVPMPFPSSYPSSVSLLPADATAIASTSNASLIIDTTAISPSINTQALSTVSSSPAPTAAPTKTLSTAATSTSITSTRRPCSAGIGDSLFGNCAVHASAGTRVTTPLHLTKLVVIIGLLWLVMKLLW